MRVLFYRDARAINKVCFHLSNELSITKSTYKQSIRSKLVKLMKPELASLIHLNLIPHGNLFSCVDLKPTLINIILFSGTTQKN